MKKGYNWSDLEPEIVEGEHEWHSGAWTLKSQSLECRSACAFVCLYSGIPLYGCRQLISWVSHLALCFVNIILNLLFVNVVIMIIIIIITIIIMIPMIIIIIIMILVIIIIITIIITILIIIITIIMVIIKKG